MLDKELTRAGFGPRAAAYLMDRALLLIALGVVRLPFGIAALLGADGMTAKSFLFDHSALDVICWALASAYFVLLTWFGGATLGKKVMRLRVIRSDGEPMRFVDVLYRETVGRFLSGILCLGYLMVLADREKRGFHDWLCGTCVVYDGVTIPERKRRDPAANAWTPGGAALPTPEAEETALPDAAEEAAPAAPAAPGWSLPGETRPEDE